MKRKKILCVCYGNTCRSPMLQALLTQELQSKGVEVEVESAGLADKFGASASHHTIECMKEKGLDITNHRSRRVSDLNLALYDHIYCVEESLVPQLIALGAPEKEVEVVEKERGGINNPYGSDLETYRACAEVLACVATALAGKLGHNEPPQ